MTPEMNLAEIFAIHNPLCRISIPVMHRNGNISTKWMKRPMPSFSNF